MRKAKRIHVRHESEPSFIRKTYSIGDTVGIRIHKVDRTNTDSNISPCKVLEVKKVNKGNNKITELRTILQRESQNS